MFQIFYRFKIWEAAVVETPAIFTWWRHQMETFSALLALCAGNSPVTGEFPSQRPVTRSFDAFFDLRLNKRLSKQSRGWWFEMPSCSLWRHCIEERLEMLTFETRGIVRSCDKMCVRLVNKVPRVIGILLHQYAIDNVISMWHCCSKMCAVLKCIGCIGYNNSKRWTCILNLIVNRQFIIILFY